MTYNIDDQINYLVEHKNNVPIHETKYITSIIHSLEYLKLFMDSNKKELFVVEHPNIKILDKLN